MNISILEKRDTFAKGFFLFKLANAYI